MTPTDLDATPADIQPDAVMAEVRANRDAYAAKFDYDVRAILRRVRERATESEVHAEQREPRRYDPEAA